MARAPVPTFFPQLQLTQRRTQESDRAAVPQSRLKPKKIYKPNDKVLVFDNKTKLNSDGVVKDVKSNNSYTVFVDGRDKHISGDHMSLLNENVNRQLPVSLPDETLTVCDDSDSISDTISIDSDDESVYTPPMTHVTHRQLRGRGPYRTEAQKLRDSLSIGTPLSRLRSGRP